MGDSRYLLEPNVKEGKGGLRDLQTLVWLARHIYDTRSWNDLVQHDVLTRSGLNSFLRARRFLWTVRCHLHYLTGRAEERLTFDLQPQVAQAMGYRDRARSSGVERFMKRYYLVAKEVGTLTRTVCAALEEQFKHKPRFVLPRFGPTKRRINGFIVQGNRLTLDDPELFAKRPLAMLEFFQIAQARELDYHPLALTALVPQPAARRSGAARRSRGQPAVPRHADQPQGPGADADADERGRAARPLRARVRPGRGADAAQPLPRLHGGRAHHPGDRRPAPDRGRRARGGAAAVDQDHAAADLAHRALSSRPSCTISARDAAAITARSARGSRSSWRRASASATPARRRWPGSSAIIW